MKLCHYDYTDCPAFKPSRLWFDFIILVIKSKWNKNAQWYLVRHPCKATNKFGLATLNVCNFVQHKRNTVNACDKRLQRDTRRDELHSPLKILCWQEIHLRDMRLPSFSLCERIVLNDKQINGLLKFLASATERPRIYLGQWDPCNFPMRMRPWKVCILSSANILPTLLS